jgi:hypothetical protein
MPKSLGSRMQGTLQIPNQAFQAFATAPRWGKMIGDHACMAEIEQKGCLLRGEAKQVLVVVVDDFHQIRKQHVVIFRTKPSPLDAESRHPKDVLRPSGGISPVLTPGETVPLRPWR